MEIPWASGFAVLLFDLCNSGTTDHMALFQFPVGQSRKNVVRNHLIEFEANFQTFLSDT